MAQAVLSLMDARPVAPDSIATLWEERQRRFAALMDAGRADDGVVDDEGANDALWEIEDQMMATPATSLEDVAIKARTIRSHRQHCGEFITGLQEQIELLFADIERLSAA